MDTSSPWLAAIVESSDDAIISKTLQGVITSWNPAAERLFGYTAREAIGQPVAMLVPPDRTDEEPRILERIGRGERVDHFETVRLRKDGSPVHVSVTISPVRNAAGQVVGASKIARDIGERKRADARLKDQLARLHMLDQITRAIGEHQDVRSIHQVALRSVEERMPLDFACICMLDAARHQLVVAHVGIHSSALAMALAMTEQGHLSIDANGLSRCLAGRLVYEADTGALDFPFPRRLAEGGLKSVVMAPLQSDNKVAGMLVAARREAGGFSSTDCEFLLQLSTHIALAARHADLHASLQRAYGDLRASQQAVMRHERLRAVGQMASGVAHDINNIVFPATVFAKELLEGEPGLSPQGREQLQSVVRALDDVTSTVTRLREFYRPREVKQQMSPVALNPLVRQVLALARPRCADLALRGVEVRLQAELDEHVPEVIGLESEIREALMNLVFNAIDAMPDGGTLSVRTRSLPADAQDRAGPAAEIAVRDNGVGMDEETRQRCLEPFYTTKGEHGTGMGLAMVRDTAQRHGAEVSIASALGEGTTISLRFPAAAPPQAPQAPPEAPAAAPVPAAPHTPRRILVIDDDPLVLETLQIMLQAGGHTTIPASGGQAGIDLFQQELGTQQRFDLVLSDLGMPKVDGHAVASAVKRLSPATPVVLLTGWGEGLQHDARPNPAVDLVMSKPPRLRDLHDAIARLTAA